MHFAHFFDFSDQIFYDACVEYRLNTSLFRKLLLTKGYNHLAGFAAAHNIHRNTLQNLVAGQSVLTATFAKIAAILDIDPLELLLPQIPLNKKIPGVEELQTLVAALTKQNKEMAIILLGSHAKGKAKKYSDWDIGVFSQKQPISGIQYLQMKRLTADMTEDHVRPVDLINLNQAPRWFLQQMEDNVVFLAGNMESFIYLKGLLDGIQREKEVA